MILCGVMLPLMRSVLFGEVRVAFYCLASLLKVFRSVKTIAGLWDEGEGQWPVVKFARVTDLTVG